jgi:glycosyltransferase involved in cell wall biosynthesis
MAALLIVGPVPPPVNGFSFATQTMLDACRAKADVRLLDTSRGAGAVLAAFVATAAWFIRRRPQAMYVAVSGGPRQLIDLVASLIIRGLATLVGMRLRVCAHHHSFRYLNEKSRLTGLLVRALGARALHVVLCERMANLLVERYSVDHVRVLSNAILVAEQGRPPDDSVHRDRLVLGHLSNLSEEKGVFAFLDLCARLRNRGLPVHGIVAGPVPEPLKVRFEEAAEAAGAQHVGALYGEAKARFFSSLDAFVFPTRYRNEAEPLVIWEAFSAGLPVLSFDVGCISEIVAQGCGTVVSPAKRDPLADFERTVMDWAGDRRQLECSSQAARAHFLSSRLLAREVLDATVTWMTNES